MYSVAQPLPAKAAAPACVEARFVRILIVLTVIAGISLLCIAGANPGRAFKPCPRPFRPAVECGSAAQLIAGVRHVSVLSWNQLIQNAPSRQSSMNPFFGVSYELSLQSVTERSILQRSNPLVATELDLP